MFWATYFEQEVWGLGIGESSTYQADVIQSPIILHDTFISKIVSVNLMPWEEPLPGTMSDDTGEISVACKH